MEFKTFYQFLSDLLMFANLNCILKLPLWKWDTWDFPSGPVVKTLSFQCRGRGHFIILYHSFSSLVAQTVKNVPAMQETRVQSRVWPEKKKKKS